MEQIRKHGGNIKEISKCYGLKESEIIDFSANINPLGPPLGVFKVIESNLDKIALYPDIDSRELKKSLAQYLDLDQESITLGNGASELIFLIINYLRPSKVWIPTPTFSEYEIAARANRAEVERIALESPDFKYFDLEKLQNMNKGDILFICNPNNPTGQLFKTETLDEILDIVNKKEAYLVLDESFLDFLEERDTISFMKKIKTNHNLFILYSLTKFFAIPGLRLGSVITSRDMANSLDKIRDPWNINVFAQLAGVSALNDKEFIKRTREFFKTERIYFYEKLKEIPGIDPFVPTANYIFVKLLDPYNSGEVIEALLKEKIMVRNCNTYPNLGEGYLRFAIKKREQNDRLLQKLRFILK